MSHYTDQNRISDKAWMESVLGQMGLQNQKPEEINEDDKSLEDFHNSGKLKYIAFIDHLAQMTPINAMILLEDFMTELLNHSKGSISPQKIRTTVNSAIGKYQMDQVDLRNKANKDAMEQ